MTNTCCGNCNGNNEDCTLKRIESKETLDKLLKPLNSYLQWNEILQEENFELHRMNSVELKEKIKEQEINTRDKSLHGIIEFNDYNSLERKEFYDNLKKNH